MRAHLVTVVCSQVTDLSVAAYEWWIDGSHGHGIVTITLTESSRCAVL